MGICSVIALVCAIIVIMPKIDFPKTKTGKIDKTSPFYNPLFFGHFAHISILEYKQEYAKRLQTDAQISMKFGAIPSTPRAGFIHAHN